MSLPVIALPTAVVELEGGQSSVAIRSLTHAEAMAMGDLGTDDVAKADAQLLAHATDTPLEEVREWLSGAPIGVVTMLRQRILEISGLAAGTGKESNGA